MTALTDGTDRRRFLRQPFSSRVTCERLGAITVASLIDVSLHGALVELAADADLTIGDHVVLTLPLDRGTTSICMKTRVAHRSGRRAGLCCVAIDIDDMTHLRRLMELNAGDTELFVREFSALQDVAADFIDVETPPIPVEPRAHIAD